ncbi:MAG: DUF1223 domain-containing protein [Polyangiaceae bacterium]
MPMLAAITLTDCTPKEAHASAAAQPVLVELFTSEGCSSCPPADSVLADLEAKQPMNGATIIPLAFHVDYWNNLGWRDPFSSADWTERQKSYARALRDNSVYTPEMVVDGRDSFVGSREGHAQDVIADAAKRPKASVNLTTHVLQGSRSITAVVGALPSGSGPADLFLALTEPHAQINVTGGENGGRMLDHTAIVRSLRVVGAVAAVGGSFEVPADSAPNEKRRAVIFVQERATRAILGVATISL